MCNGYSTIGSFLAQRTIPQKNEIKLLIKSRMTTAQIGKKDVSHSSQTPILADEKAKIKMNCIHSFGVSSSIPKSIAFLSDHMITYHVGKHVAVYNLENGEMSFFNDNNHVERIQVISVSPNLELIGIGEVLKSEISKSSTEQRRTFSLLSQMTIYRTSTRTKMKTIAPISSTALLSCCFTGDNKYLITLSDGPDYSLCCWKWKSAKLIATGYSPSKATCVRVNPCDYSMITTSGLNHLKLWSLDSEWKMHNLLSIVKEQCHFVDHLWIKESNKMVAITDQGLIHVFGSGGNVGMELKHTLQAVLTSTDCRIQTATVCLKGFMLTGTHGYFSVYEMTKDSKKLFRHFKSFSSEEDTIQSIAVSSNDETVMAITTTDRILSFPMKNLDSLSEDQNHFNEVFNIGSHSGTVLAMCICTQRPLVVSCGFDRMIRGYNYLSWKCEILYQLSEDPLSVSLHPNGFQLLVGVKDRVQIYHVLHNDLRLFRDIPLKQCKDVEYAHKGHYFACANGTTVSVFTTITLENVYNFTGHLGPVQKVQWYSNDCFLYSAGLDGGIYGWNMDTGGKMENVQHVVKHSQYTSLVVNGCNPEHVLVAGNDGKVQEILDGTMNQILDTDLRVTQIVLSKTNQFLLAGTSSGNIRIYPFPLKDEYSEYRVHQSGVVQMCLTKDEFLVFSCSEDGSLFSFGIYWDDGKEQVALQLNKQQHFNVDVVLLSKEEMEEKNALVAESKLRMDQSKSDLVYALHRKEIEWMDKMKIQEDEFQLALQAQKHQYKELHTILENTKCQHSEEKKKRNSEQLKLNKEIQNQYEQKLLLEMEKCDQLSEKVESLRQNCNLQLATQEAKHQEILEKERKISAQNIEHEMEMIKKLNEDVRLNEMKFQEIFLQQEKEYELEIEQLKQMSQQTLQKEQNLVKKKGGELNSQQFKYDILLKRLQEVKSTSKTRDALLESEKVKTNRLEEMLSELEKDIEERIENLAEKDRCISSLRVDNRTLNNFRYVLDYKVMQLQEENGPIQEHVAELEKHVRDMYNELVLEYQRKAHAEADMDNKNKKIKALTKEISQLRIACKDKERIIENLNDEITEIVHLNSSKEIENAIKNVYRVFVKGESRKINKCSTSYSQQSIQSQQQHPIYHLYDGNPTLLSFGGVESQGKSIPLMENMTPGKQKTLESRLGYDDKQVCEETRKQREQTQKSVESLKVSVKTTRHFADKARQSSISENSFLISECNSLRKENRILLQKVKELDQSTSPSKQSTVSTPSKQSVVASPSKQSVVASPSKQSVVTSEASSITLNPHPNTPNSSISSDGSNSNPNVVYSKNLSFQPREEICKQPILSLSSSEGMLSSSKGMLSSNEGMLSSSKGMLSSSKGNGFEIGHSQDCFPSYEAKKKGVVPLTTNYISILSPVPLTTKYTSTLSPLPRSSMSRTRVRRPLTTDQDQRLPKRKAKPYNTKLDKITINAHLTKQIEKNNQQIEMQKKEIQRLRNHVQHFLTEENKDGKTT